MAVVLKGDETKGVDQAVSAVAGDDVDLFFFQRTVDQTEIEHAGRFAELQLVAFRPAFITIGAFEKFVTNAGAPMRSERSDVGDFDEVILARIVTADDHGESVFKAERFGDFERETAGVFVAHTSIDGIRIASGIFTEDGGKSGSGIFDIKIDIAVQHGFVNQESAAEIGFAFDGNPGPRFDVLGEEFGEDDLFGKEFGGDDEMGFARSAARGEEQGKKGN